MSRSQNLTGGSFNFKVTNVTPPTGLPVPDRWFLHVKTCLLASLLAWPLSATPKNYPINPNIIVLG